MELANRENIFCEWNCEWNCEWKCEYFANGPWASQLARDRPAVRPAARPVACPLVQFLKGFGWGVALGPLGSLISLQVPSVPDGLLIYCRVRSPSMAATSVALGPLDS